MALTLVTNPVQTVSGEVLNLFAGFDDVEFIFKREDLQSTLIEQGVDDTIKVNLSTDLSSYLEVGDSVYLYAEAFSQDYNYDDTYEVLEVDTNFVRLDGDFTDQASGYINYKKNYYVEMNIVSPVNNDIKLIPFTLRDDGDSEGNITIDISIVNDLNKFDFLEEDEFTGNDGLVMEDARIKIQVQYREVYDEATGSYTTVTDEIILVYCATQPESEEILNSLTLPEVYKGYPFFFTLNHSDSNVTLEAVNVYYDTLDLNKYDIDVNNLMKRFSAARDYGFLMCHFDKSTSVAAATEYVKFKAEFANLPEYEPSEYNNLEYKVT